jgi:MFS family permease
MARTDQVQDEEATAGRPGQASPSTLVAVLVFLAVVSTAVASLGAPLLVSIAQVEHVSLASSQWSLTITLLVGAVAVPLLDRLGDGRHRRATTLAGVAAVTAGCVLSAVPAGFALMLTGRAFQGVGLGLVPLATAIARDNLPAGRPAGPSSSWAPRPPRGSARAIPWLACSPSTWACTRPSGSARP